MNIINNVRKGLMKKHAKLEIQRLEKQMIELEDEIRLLCDRRVGINQQIKAMKTLNK